MKVVMEKLPKTEKLNKQVWRNWQQGEKLNTLLAEMHTVCPPHEE